MLLPVQLFMTKSNLDLALKLVTPLGFLGSLRVVTRVSFVPCLTTRPAYTWACSQRETFFGLSQMMFGLKKRVPGLDTPKWDQGYWEGVCVWAWSGNTGHVMRETAWPCSSFIRSFKDHKHPPVCTAQLQGTWACLLGCEGHTQDLSTTGPCPYHVEDDLTQRESRGRLTATLQLLWEQLEEMHSNVVSQLLGKQKKSSL